MPSVEDIELGMRLTAAGSAIVLDPAIQGTHLKRWTLVQMVRTDLFKRGIPWVQLLLESRERLVRAQPRLAPSPEHASVLVGFGALLLAGSALPLRRVPGRSVILNHSFYSLLARRRGGREAVAGIGLHSLHHLTAAASSPARSCSAVARRASSRM